MRRGTVQVQRHELATSTNVRVGLQVNLDALKKLGQLEDVDIEALNILAKAQPATLAIVWAFLTLIMGIAVD